MHYNDFSPEKRLMAKAWIKWAATSASPEWQEEFAKHIKEVFLDKDPEGMRRVEGVIKGMVGPHTKGDLSLWGII